MVLNEGSLRNTAMGVFTQLYIDMHNADKIQPNIMVFKTLNDPVLYVALLPECWVTTVTSPPTHTHNKLWISSHWLGKQQDDPPPAKVRKHDWLHMPAFSTITTAGIYLAGPHHVPPLPPPSFLLIRSLRPPCQEVRHRLVKGEPLGRGTLILRSQKLSFIGPPSRLHTSSVMQDYVRRAESFAGIYVNSSCADRHNNLSYVFVFFLFSFSTFNAGPGSKWSNSRIK